MEKEFRHFQIKEIDAGGKFLMHPIELKDYIEFPVKRVYYVTYPMAPTGSHCHKTEEELFVVLRGSCTLVVDRGNGLEEMEFKGPLDAAYVPNYVWHHFKDFSSDTILLALSSTNYQPDRSDYIEDYEIFLEERKKKVNL